MPPRIQSPRPSHHPAASSIPPEKISRHHAASHHHDRAQGIRIHPPGILRSYVAANASEHHRDQDQDVPHGCALSEQERLERIGDDAADLAGEASCHAAFKAFDVLLAAPATTLPGIVAKLAYLQDIANRDAWMFTDRPDAAIHLLEGFAASIANVWRVQS